MGVIYAAVPFGGVVGALLLPAIAQFLGWSAGYRLVGQRRPDWRIGRLEAGAKRHRLPALPPGLLSE